MENQKKHSSYRGIAEGGVGERGEITRCSDDGEPSGTAGLVRAYTRALQEGLAACKIARLSYGTALELETDYTLVGKVQYLLGKEGIGIDDTRYTDQIVFCIFLLEDEKERIIKEITEATAGRCRITVKDSFYAPVIRKE